MDSAPLTNQNKIEFYFYLLAAPSHASIDWIPLGPHYASAPKEEKAAKLRQMKRILKQ